MGLVVVPNPNLDGLLPSHRTISAWNWRQLVFAFFGFFLTFISRICNHVTLLLPVSIVLYCTCKSFVFCENIKQIEFLLLTVHRQKCTLGWNCPEHATSICMRYQTLCWSFYNGFKVQHLLEITWDFSTWVGHFFVTARHGKSPPLTKSYCD